MSDYYSMVEELRELLSDRLTLQLRVDELETQVEQLQATLSTEPAETIEDCDRTRGCRADIHYGNCKILIAPTSQQMMDVAEAEDAEKHPLSISAGTAYELIQQVLQLTKERDAALDQVARLKAELNGQADQCYQAATEAHNLRTVISGVVEQLSLWVKP